MVRVKMELTAVLTVVGLLIFSLTVGIFSVGAQQGTKPAYPAPRFPVTLKNPRSVQEVMPYARALARNKSNFLGMGLGVLNPGDKTLLVGDANSEGIFTEALKRALAERKVEATVVHDYQVAGVPRDQALAYLKAVAGGDTSEQGFKEGCNWLNSFPGSIPWLKQHRPDIHDACFPKKTTDLPEDLKAIGLKLRGTPGSRSPIATYIVKYIDQHPDLRGVFFGKGGPVWMQLTPHEDKWLGIFNMDSKWDVMSNIGSFPADVWLLAEEQTIEPLTSVDKVQVTDPEGVDVWWDMTEEQAQRWVRGVYVRGHLYMFPNQTYGQFGQSTVDYPAIHRDYIAREPIVMLNGTVAGTNGHGGFFPRIEQRWTNGYLTEVKGGGLYGELLRTVMKYPRINEVTYPQHTHPGYFYHFETALATNPKFVRHGLDRFGGTSPERMRAGVIHWALGAYFWHDPGPSYKGREELIRNFAEANQMPGAHGFHIHTYFSTYRVHLRNSNKWLTLLDKGRLTSLDSPQARALASRYGDPDKLLATDWIPEIPGINVPGQYQDYANAPYNYSQGVMEKIEAGTYSHFYPPDNKRAALGGEGGGSAR